ncbi:hypothetical protein PABY_04820 [Pyrodictium abyssi]|uniref:KaiC-like domain-containing protein n=1 Tax=Pyrodictium abyssi TaxID=54256 RepID=A0ABM8IWI0_9CREN|nr:hypothetical protein PABY_04820 [Pyrodictium abyssi]
MSFVEPHDEFLEHMKRLGLDLRSYEEKGLVHYMEALTVVDEEALIAQLEEMAQFVEEHGIRRLVVNSVTVILQMVGDKTRAREFMQNFFVNAMKKLGVVTLLIAEHPYGAKTVGYGVKEFVVDAVIVLRLTTLRGKAYRIMELRKAR